MSTQKPLCFVIMPFSAELHYFFLYLQVHIKNTHNIDCLRGDAQVLTISLLEKINEYIKNADVIIADCSGRNPNVFYELGIAQAHEKKVILITQDRVEEAPTDIRHLEFIRYELHKHREFLERLDNALSNVFLYRYEVLYGKAKEIFRRFKRDTNASVNLATKEIFVQRLAASGNNPDLPKEEDEVGIIELVLPRIIAGFIDISLMSTISKWTSEQK